MPAAIKIAAGILNLICGGLAEMIGPHHNCTIDQLVSRPQRLQIMVSAPVDGTAPDPTGKSAPSG